MDGNREGYTSPKGLGAQQLVLDPPADPYSLIPEELFSLWLPPHDLHPSSENKTLVYFPETNKKESEVQWGLGDTRIMGSQWARALFYPE